MTLIGTVVTEAAWEDRRVDDIRVRPMVEADAASISAAFAAIGWHKPMDLFLRYVSEAATGARVSLVAERRGAFAGYATLQWMSDYPPFRDAGTPEIVDLNVLPGHRRHGVGAALLDRLEATAGERSPVVGLGVGLHQGYGAAQRLYVRRGYVPDGRGVMYDNAPVAEGATVPIDDAATLMLIKSRPGR